MKAQTPDLWRRYDCNEYFADGWWQRGHFDELSQTLVIVPLDEAYESSEIHFFALGRSGADGIDFGYRERHAGLWAYYPIEGEFKLMAPSIKGLVRDWCSGALSV